MPAYNTDEMLLIYRSETGELYHQSWRDLVESGTLIDPESGEDMECVGWCLPNDA